MPKSRPIKFSPKPRTEAKDIKQTPRGFVDIKKEVRRYGLNLIGHYPFNAEFMALLFSILDEKHRRRFIHFIYTHSRRPECADLQEECLEMLTSGDDPEDIGRRVTDDIRLLKIRLRKRLLEGFFEKSGTVRAGFGKKDRAFFETLKLNDDEVEILVFIHCVSQNRLLESLFDTQGLPNFLKYAAHAVGMDHDKFLKYVGKNGQLFRCGLIQDYNETVYDYLRINRYVKDFFLGLSDTPFSEEFLQPAPATCYPLSSFNFPDVSKNVLLSIVTGSAPFNVLLYGPAGVGKTEFVSTLIHETGIRGYFVQHGREETAEFETRNRRLPIAYAAGLISHENGVLIIDEADMFLNSEYMFMTDKETTEKGWLNSLLDKNRSKIIWITNDIESIHPSTLRRFQYSLEFKDFVPGERKNIWHVQLETHPHKACFCENTVNMLSHRYRINAGGIGNALHTLTQILPDTQTDQQTVVDTVCELLERHQRLVNGRKSDRFNNLSRHYDISALNTDGDIRELLSAVKTFSGQKNRISGSNINILFWGLPGSGKTELAKYLAMEAGLELLVKRASTLLDCYVGETEKHIRNAFDEAARSNAILLIDEADSFLSARKNAQRSWEVTQVNELLTQIENHTGILICCTNLLSRLDHASLRRFAWKIEFKPLKPDARLSLYHLYFQHISPLPGQQQMSRIRAINGLTPGDVKAVWLKIRYTPAEELCHSRIIEMLEKETSYKTERPRQKIGFWR